MTEKCKKGTETKRQLLSKINDFVCHELVLHPLKDVSSLKVYEGLSLYTLKTLCRIFLINISLNLVAKITRKTLVNLAI